MALLGVGHALRDEIMAVERRRVDAMVAEDIETLATMLADELTYTHSGGRFDTKQSFLELIAAPDSHYRDVQYSDEEVIDLGSGTVLVRGVARIMLRRETGEEPDYRVLFVDVYTRRDGRWQMVAWQATRIPDESRP